MQIPGTACRAIFRAWGRLRRRLHPPRDRAFTRAETRALEAALTELPDDEAGRRLHCLMTWLGTLGLRAEEMLAARISQLREIREEEGESEEGPSRWELTVKGKRGRVRELPVPRPAIAALSVYLETRGLSLERLEEAKAAPVIATLGGKGRALTYPPLYDLVTEFLEKVPELAGKTMKPASIARFRTASTYWLRHTFATRLANHHVDQHVV